MTHSSVTIVIQLRTLSP